MSSPTRPGDPENVGRYRIIRRLGRGGMGTVYLARDPTGQPVAIKVINAELADDESFRDRFRREVTAAQRVPRFCTAQVLDAELWGDPLFVVTEFVEGSTLDRAVAERGTMSGGQLESLALNIAQALSAIHGSGIVHRDLKPANVMLCPYGPRVIDFGIARALDADGGQAAGRWQISGTPAYMAPELMDGGPLTPAADIFSWGCVVAYANTGRSPFAGPTVAAVVRRVTSAPPQLAGLDPALHELVSAALDKDPVNRPTARDLVAQLTGPDTTESEITRTDLPRRRPRRRLIALAAGAVVAAAAAAAIAYPKITGDRPAAPIAPLVSSNEPAEQRAGWWTGYLMRLEGKTTKRSLNVPHDSGGADSHTLSPRARIDVKVRITLASGSADAGIFCRSTGGYSGSYWLLVRTDGTAAAARLESNGEDGDRDEDQTDARAEDDRVRSLASGRAGLRRDGLNQLQAECVYENGAAHLSLWVNGDLVVRAVDRQRPFIPVTTGLIAHRSRSAPAAYFYFDDFAAYRI